MKEDWERVLHMRVERLKRLEKLRAPASVIEKEKELIATARRKLGQQ